MKVRGMRIAWISLFLVTCNLDTGITVHWTIEGAAPGSTSCGSNNIVVEGTSTSGAAARTTLGQAIGCLAGAVTILNWASGNWYFKVSLVNSVNTIQKSGNLGSATAPITVTEGQTTDIGTANLTTGDGGSVQPPDDAGVPTPTTVAIAFSFAGTGNTACSTADLSGTGGATVTNPLRGLRYKLVCSGTEYKNTTDNAAQQTLCSTSPTAVAAFTVAQSGSCTLEAQLLDDDPATSGTPYPEHCDYYATSTVSVTASQANSLTIDLAKQVGGGVCPLTKQLN